MALFLIGSEKKNTGFINLVELTTIVQLSVQARPRYSKNHRCFLHLPGITKGVTQILETRLPLDSMCNRCKFKTLASFFTNKRVFSELSL